MSSFLKILKAFSQAQGWSLWWSDAASDREREGEEKQGLWDVRREKQANHISNLYLLLLPPNYRVVCGQVAEDGAWKATDVAFLSWLLSRNSISLTGIIKALDFVQEQIRKIRHKDTLM